MPQNARPELRVTLRLMSLHGPQEESIELAVDPSALYTWIPKEVTERVGVRDTNVWRFRTAAGATIERRVGDVRIEVEGHQGATVVVFAEPEDRVILGSLALTSVGLEADPATGILREMEYFLALATA